MDISELKSLREELFNEDFTKVKSPEVDKIIRFGEALTEVTGIQVCNSFGLINELLPAVYKSVVS